MKILFSFLPITLLIAVAPAQATPIVTPQPPTVAAKLAPNQVMSAPVSTIPLGEGDDYMLGAGDRLKLDLFNVPELSGDHQVLPNGTLNLPRVGTVSVQGLTLKQASERISVRYSNYLTRPIATLSLMAGRPVNVVIAGEITRPGSYAMSSAVVAPNGEVPTLTRLLQLAEGITQSANLQQIQIQRRQPGGGTQVYTVNLWQLAKAADNSQNIRLQDGDSVYIPENTDINLANAQQLPALNFATRTNRPLRIVVTGEVARPGPYTIFEGNAAQSAQRTETPNSVTPTITQALQVAGGITQMADLRSIKVRRIARSGRELQATVNFWELLNGDGLQDLPLQDGDRIEIARANVNDQEATQIANSSFSPDRITVNIVGEVRSPGGVAVKPSTPLNQALLAAGGFNDQAKKKNVTLVRLETNGTVSKRQIAVNFAEGLNEANNPALRNGDTVIVEKSAIGAVGSALNILTSPISGAMGLLRLLGIFR
jgi:polysaccharide biosynthesis/export protein